MMNLRTARYFLLLYLLGIAAALFPVSAVRAQAQLPPPLTLGSSWQLQDVARATDAPEQISAVDYKPSHWFKATVPGTVLTSLVADGVYPEPLYGENNRPDKIPESLCRTSYWYRTTVKIPNSFKNRHVWLNFDGINYRAEVWVNGHRAGDIAGAFARGIFDVTAYVTVGASNAIAVKILPQPHPGNPVEQTIARGVGPNGGISALDGPTFLCTIGWDWIPGIRDRDMGIWQNVTLTATGSVTVNDPNVVTDLPLPRTDSADLTVEATLRNLTSQPQTGTLTGTFGDARYLGINLGTKESAQESFAQIITLAPNETRVVTLTPATTPALHLNNPILWWPNGYGQPNLYHMKLEFVMSDKTVSDTRELNFGVRKITYAVPGSENLTLSVNGVPVLCKGGDWGMDEAMKRIPRARLDAQVRMHRDANFTMIRNWVGQSTSEDFYDACDKYGILLWDEMFQPNPSDGPNADDLPLYLANVREKLLRFRSHPSIAVWCARNEGFPPPNIDAGIQALMAELEHSGRLYQRSSTDGRGVRSSGPYFWRAPREYYNVDAPFKTEIGTVSIPTLESIQSMMPAKDWNVINDDWAEHDLASGAQGGDRFPLQMTDRYGPIANLADFARKGQMASYEAFRALFEGRNSKLFQPTTGVITWMSNPSQPSFVWQIYSWDLEPCAALYASKLACEPIHIQMNESTDRNGHVEVINNTPTALTGLTVKATVLNLDGKVAFTQTIPARSAAASAATDLGVIAFPATVSQVHFVKLTLNDVAGKQISQNFYWRATPDAPDDLRALNQLPQVTLDATAEVPEQYGAAGFRVKVTLYNPTSTVALMTHLQLRHTKSNTRILPVSYSDNYFSLLPGETRTVFIEAAFADLQSSLRGDRLFISVDGWNVGVRDISNQRSTDAPGFIVTNPDVKIPVAATPIAPEPQRGKGPFALAIDCGGNGVSSGFFTFGAPLPTKGFLADRNFAGGHESGTGNTVLVQGIAHAAPESVYQSERWGASTYTVKVSKPMAGHSYTVRLHFADTTYDAKGARRFNVAIGGVPRLTDFDIIAEAGGKDRALVKEFAGVAPNEKGNIVIDLTRGMADEPEIRGVEIVAAEGEPSAEATPPQASALTFDNPSWGLGTFVKADAANPVLSPLPTTFPDPMQGGKAVAWEHDHTFNPAAVVRDGKIYVLYRAEDNSGEGIGGHTSRLGLAESTDGLHFTRLPAPVVYPDKDTQQGNEWPGGCEDPRLVETTDGRYVLTYTQWNRKVARLAVATSTDLLHWDKHGPAFAAAYDGRFRDLFCKSGAIVTRPQGNHLIATKINGKYWMLWGEGSIHAATSDDLIVWTPVLDAKDDLLAVFTTRKGKFDSGLVEGGPPAVLTDKGIVMLYNGKNAGGDAGDTTIGGGAYSGGMALLDKNDPTKVLERTSSFFFTPERTYEKTGQYAAGTTFLEGLVPFQGRWFLYYGTADSFVAVATTKTTH